MATILSFQKAALQKIADEYSRIQATPEQRAIIDQLADLLCQYTGMSKLPMKGFIWKAMKTWQQTYHQPCSSVLVLPFNERAKKVKEMLQILEEQYLSRILRDPIDRTRLSQAIKAAYEYYKQIGTS